MWYVFNIFLSICSQWHERFYIIFKVLEALIWVNFEIFYPDQVSMSGENKKKSPVAFKHHFNMGRNLQQDSMLDHQLKEEQQRRFLSESASYKAMQVCIDIIITIKTSYRPNYLVLISIVISFKGKIDRKLLVQKMT